MDKEGSVCYVFYCLYVYWNNDIYLLNIYRRERFFSFDHLFIMLFDCMEGWVSFLVLYL